MIFDSARLAILQIFSPGFRSVLWKSLGLTIALLAGVWFAANFGVSAFLIPLIGAETWTATIIYWLLGVGFVIGLGFLIAPVTAIFGGFFIDEIAFEVEQKHYFRDPPGRDLPTAESAVISIKFIALVIATNLVAVMLLLVPGVNLAVFFIANGYLLGREYFQFAALRFLPEAEAEALRQKYSMSVFLAGLLIAAFVAIPLLNLLTPLFAAALMVHLFKKLQRKSASAF